MSHHYSAALRRVSRHFTDYGAKGRDMLDVLLQWERDADEPDPAGWDTAEAVYWLSYSWHGGQWCPLYAAGCATEYRPGPCSNGVEPDSVAALILEELEAIERGEPMEP